MVLFERSSEVFASIQIHGHKTVAILLYDQSVIENIVTYSVQLFSGFIRVQQTNNTQLKFPL